MKETYSLTLSTFFIVKIHKILNFIIGYFFYFNICTEHFCYLFYSQHIYNYIKTVYIARVSFYIIYTAIFFDISVS